MNPVGSVYPSLNSAAIGRIDAPLPKALSGPLAAGQTGATPEGFGQLLNGLISSVDAKDQEAKAVTRKVLLGENDQIHQSVIAMQEASVAFSLMVEVRNKLVESYQELMRMQA
jgi:flagellar hook-basal body complex protein FliE